MNDPYTYRSYRREWRVEFWVIDQYGKAFESYYFEGFPDKEIAQSRLEQLADKNQFNGRWIPKERPHEFVEAGVRYREIEVPDRYQEGYERGYSDGRMAIQVY